MVPRGDHVTLFDAATGKVLVQHVKPGYVCVAPDGRAFYGCGHDTPLSARDFASGKELWKTPVGYSGTWLGLHIAPDGNSLLINRHTGEGVLVDARSGKVVFTFTESILKAALPGAARYALSFSPGGYVVAGGGSPEKSAFFDARGGRRISVIDVPRQSAVSPDGRFVAASKSPKTILLFEIRTGKAHELECPARNEGQNMVVAWTPDSKYLFCSGGYGIGLFGVGPWR
jgi:WD40 repeat protein